MGNKKYNPVDCNFYDHLESAATRGVYCHIVIKGSSGEQEEIRGKIKNLETADEVEYAVMENGTRFRLDEIVTFEGIENK